ncbi:MAG: polyprenyl synthetase family protein [Sphingobacteriaceae bacterium]|nr:polyprenyl synthetase family protein [Sphingobacteriaceae bacterium]
MHNPIALQEIIEKAISQISYPNQPKKLYDPIQYIMNLGGKRIRPILVLMSAELFNDNLTPVIDAALAIETFHNFTLIHDDIMDNAPLRRGEKTVHEIWGTNNAILSGDVMMVEANKHLAKLDSAVLKDALETFNTTAQGVCEGQQLDMEFEQRDDVTIAEYIEMIRLKTAVLLGGAMKLGAQVAGANAQQTELIYQYGESLGIAFQLQDDILDVYGNPEKFGKQVGGDIIANKKTFLMLTALQLISPEEKKEMFKNYATEAEKIKHVTELYNKYKIEELANKEAERYIQIANHSLNSLPVLEERKVELKQLTQQLLNRSY